MQGGCNTDLSPVAGPTLLFLAIIGTSGPKLAFQARGAGRSCLHLLPPPPPPPTPDTQPFSPGEQVVSQEGRETLHTKVKKRPGHCPASAVSAWNILPQSPCPLSAPAYHVPLNSVPSCLSLSTLWPWCTQTAWHELLRARTSGSHSPSVCPPRRPVQRPLDSAHGLIQTRAIMFRRPVRFASHFKRSHQG